MASGRTTSGAEHICQRSPIHVMGAVWLALVMREMRGRVSVHRLGAFWLLAEPIAHVLVLVGIFTLVRGRTLPGVEYPVFLVSGVVPFLMMKNVALRTMEGVASNKALFSYRQIKPLDTLAARAIVELILSICVYISISFVLGFWAGYDVLIHHPLEWFANFIVAAILSMALGIIFCILGEALPESKTVFRLIFLPLYFVSAVIFPIWMIPQDLMPYLLWNPFLHVINEFRQSAFENYPVIHGVTIIYPAGVSLVMLFLGLALYRVRRLKLGAI